MGAQPMMTVQTIQHVRMESASTLVHCMTLVQDKLTAKLVGMKPFAHAQMAMLVPQRLIVFNVS